MIFFYFFFLIRLSVAGCHSASSFVNLTSRVSFLLLLSFVSCVQRAKQRRRLNETKFKKNKNKNKENKNAKSLRRISALMLNNNFFACTLLVRPRTSISRWQNVNENSKFKWKRKCESDTTEHMSKQITVLFLRFSSCKHVANTNEPKRSERKAQCDMFKKSFTFRC